MALSDGLSGSSSHIYASVVDQDASIPKDDSPHGSLMIAPTSPLDMFRSSASKVPKLLRFDLKPAFVCDGEPSSAAYTVSVKNTFLDSFEDSDCELDLPPRSASAPSMPVLKNLVSPMAICKPTPTPGHQSECPAEGPDVHSDAMLPHQVLEVPPVLPGRAGVAISRSRSPPSTPGIALSRSHSASSLDSSCMSLYGSTTTQSSSSLNSSVAFQIKNTFIHVDVDVDGEEDIGLPLKSVSQPNLSAVEDSRYPGASEVLNVPSVGSAGHSTGQCRPCAWFWKPQSCQWGSECMHCHLCPMGELRRRKKEMQAKAKELKRAARELARASCLETEDASFDAPAQ